MRGGKSSQKAELSYALHTIETCSRAHTHGPHRGLHSVKLSLVVGVRKMKTLSSAVARSIIPCLFRPSCVPKEKNEGYSSPGTSLLCSFSFSPSEMGVIANSVLHRPRRHSCQQPLITRIPTLFRKQKPRCALVNPSQFQRPQLPQHA